jgi:hypothetical protein
MKIRLLLLIVLFVSCKSGKEGESQWEIERRRVIEERQAIMDELSRNYDLKYSWDTLYYEFSIDYEPVLLTDYQLLENVTVEDIFKRDSLTYAVVTTDGYPRFHFTFPIQEQQIQVLIDEEKHLILVVRIERLQKAAISVDYWENEYANVGFRTYNDFVGKGKIIELRYING